MFSEYASRFLAQSQSRLSLAQDQNNPPRNPLERQRGSSRGYLQRQPLSNPYQSGTQASRFPFASRLTTASNPAPLFYSATDEFQDEDDGEEHEREVADFYALQRSRRDVDAGRLKDSSELEDEDEGATTQESRQTRKKNGASGRGRGIRSSWTGDEETSSATADTAKRKPQDSQISFTDGKGKDRLVDVELASTIHEDEEEYSDVEENPPSVQQFRRPANMQSKIYDSEYDSRETDHMIQDDRPGQSMLRESVPTTIPQATPDPPRHDIFYGTAFMICVTAMFATFILVCLHTTAPRKTGSLGDTVYTTLRSSFYLLAVDTTIAIFVALVWLALLRSFVRPLVMTILVAVPVIMFSFTLYPFISSFGGRWGGSSIQDAAMRWFAFIPGIFGIIWTYTAYKGRHQFGRAVDLLDFATRVVAENPALVLVGFATLGVIVSWTWIWLLMFTRVFLGGKKATGTVVGFIIDAGTWWIGIFFILTYLWTLGVISGIQRATTAATVSQWYFHRLAVPSVPSQRVVIASLTHAATTIFGTICASTLLSLAVRLPLLVLPGRLSRYIAFFFYSFIPTSIATLTNPLTLTYAAIHSQPLTFSARGLAELSFVSDTSPTTTLTPRTFSRSHASDPNAPASSVMSYRLSKLFLFATRAIVSIAFGFAGWVSTARRLQIEGTSGGVRGSLYAYIIGLVAGAIGWTVLGAMEGVLSGVLDAVVVCWGSEVGSRGNGQARYCREAAELLKDQT